MNKPVVSIIVLAYNAEGTIEATMESLLNQKCDFDYEIVVGEDSSQDNTRPLVEEIVRENPEKVRLMPAAPNKGLVKNYFDCLRACRGEYITDCSAGDLFTAEDRLQKLVERLEKRKDLTALFTDTESTTFNSEPTVENYLAQNGDEAIVLSAMMYRASVVGDALRKAPEIVENEAFGCEDLSVICALLATGKVEKADGASFRYTKEGESVSRPKEPVEEMRFHQKTLHAIVTLANYYDSMTEKVERKLQMKLNHLGDIAFFRFDPEIYELWRKAYGEMKGRRGLKAVAKNLFIRSTAILRSF